MGGASGVILPSDIPVICLLNRQSAKEEVRGESKGLVVRLAHAPLLRGLRQLREMEFMLFITLLLSYSPLKCATVNP